MCFGMVCCSSGLTDLLCEMGIINVWHLTYRNCSVTGAIMIIKKTMIDICKLIQVPGNLVFRVVDPKRLNEGMND